MWTSPFSKSGLVQIKEAQVKNLYTGVVQILNMDLSSPYMISGLDLVQSILNIWTSPDQRRTSPVLRFLTQASLIWTSPDIEYGVVHIHKFSPNIFKSGVVQYYILQVKLRKSGLVHNQKFTQQLFKYGLVQIENLDESIFINFHLSFPNLEQSSIKISQ